MITVCIDYLIASPEEIARMNRESQPNKKFGGWKCKALQSKLEV